MNLEQLAIETLQQELCEVGYKFQFITLVGFHSLNTNMFELANGYQQRGMGAFSELQQKELSLQEEGFRAPKHQSFVGKGYFYLVQNTVAGGESSTATLKESTEAEQFNRLVA